MVSIQVRDVPPQVRDTLAESARARGQSMQAYVKELLLDDARRAGNVALLRRVRSMGGGDTSLADEAADEIAAIRATRTARHAAAE